MCVPLLIPLQSSIATPCLNMLPVSLLKRTRLPLGFCSDFRTLLKCCLDKLNLYSLSQILNRYLFYLTELDSLPLKGSPVQEQFDSMIVLFTLWIVVQGSLSNHLVKRILPSEAAWGISSSYCACCCYYHPILRGCCAKDITSSLHPLPNTISIVSSHRHDDLIPWPLKHSAAV